MSSIRRRFPLVVLLAIGVKLAWTWFAADLQRQDRLIHSAGALALGYALIFIWLIIFAPIPFRRRAAYALAMALPAVLIPSLTRIRGVTGDLLPILEWRWASNRGTAAPNGPSQHAVSETNSALSSLKGISDYPQFLGPHRDGRVQVELASDWDAQPPQELWRRPIGAAWSGFAVAGERAVTQEQADENELVTCYSIANGAPLWTHSYPARYATTIAGEGPRGTPTIESNRVYAFGGTGVLTCLDLISGKLLWTRDIRKEHGGSVPDWGMAACPLITEDLVIVTGAGGTSLVAYNKISGAPAWVSTHDGASYSSPALIEVPGSPMIVGFNAHSVSGHNPADGALLWTHPWAAEWPNVTIPFLVSTNQLLVTSGYGRGSELLELQSNGTNWTASSVWKSRRLKSKFSNVFLIDNFIYGIDDGIMACIDVKDGSLKWKDGRYGHCQMILAGDLLVFVSEAGKLTLVRPNPTELVELASMKVFNDKTWNPSALAGRYLLARNDLEAVCFLLPGEAQTGIAKPSEHRE